MVKTLLLQKEFKGEVLLAVFFGWETADFCARETLQG